MLVVPYVGTWIEMIADPLTALIDIGRSLRGNVDRNPCVLVNPRNTFVVPYVGTWIEMLSRSGQNLTRSQVVPYVGTWIEMRKRSRNPSAGSSVVPYVGTWIEISIMRIFSALVLTSFPTWERG